MKWQGKHGRRRGKERGETELSEAKVGGAAEEVINFVSCFYSRVPSTFIKLLLLPFYPTRGILAGTN